MLQARTSASPEFFATPDLVPGCEISSGETTTPFCFAREPVRPSPVLIPSIAETAGLSRFVYLIGHSQERYVFSSIRQSQISLYSEAIFLISAGEGSDEMWVGDYTALIGHLNSRPGHKSLRIHVHLLAEGPEAKSHIMLDLESTHSNRYFSAR